MQEIEKKSIETIHRRGGKRPGSGRPKGSISKHTHSIRELADQFGPAALKTLVVIMTKGKSDQARIMAARELLDRGYGKPRPAKDDYVRPVAIVNR